MDNIEDAYYYKRLLIIDVNPIIAKHLTLERRPRRDSRRGAAATGLSQNLSSGAFQNHYEIFFSSC
jgi:hypothetical protein